MRKMELTHFHVVQPIFAHVNLECVMVWQTVLKERMKYWKSVLGEMPFQIWQPLNVPKKTLTMLQLQSELSHVMEIMNAEIMKMNKIVPCQTTS